MRILLLLFFVVGTIRAEPTAPLRKRPEGKQTSADPERFSPPRGVRAVRNLSYAAPDGEPRKLDLFLPENAADDALPLIVQLHGGGWWGGHRSHGVQRIMNMVATGKYAGAAVGYRLSVEAIWPAQIQDCKTAIRWLKAHADQYGLDPERIGVFGRSAGGHLAAMLGVSAGVETFEGDGSIHPEQSSRVACVVSHCGPSDLLTLNVYSNRVEPETPESQEAYLLGGMVKDRRALARNASPRYHVTPDDAPILLVHGTHDKGVPYRQAKAFNHVLKQVGVDASLVTILNEGHRFNRHPEMEALVLHFFENHLLGARHPMGDRTFEKMAPLERGIDP
ncbi:MAG: alpha/beta hydrolase, partial [Verrucomicrobiota bacterium]